MNPGGISLEDRTNEVGLFNMAESYWKSAAALHEASPRVTYALSPVLFLYYHTIELYLKAFLRDTATPPRSWPAVNSDTRHAA